jgi:hypothetical protein
LEKNRPKRSPASKSIAANTLMQMEKRQCCTMPIIKAMQCNARPMTNAMQQYNENDKYNANYKSNAAIQ